MLVAWESDLRCSGPTGCGFRRKTSDDRSYQSNVRWFSELRWCCSVETKAGTKEDVDRVQRWRSVLGRVREAGGRWQCSRVGGYTGGGWVPLSALAGKR